MKLWLELLLASQSERGICPSYISKDENMLSTIYFLFFLLLNQEFLQPGCIASQVNSSISCNIG